MNKPQTSVWGNLLYHSSLGEAIRVIHFSLFTIHCSLFTIHCSLPANSIK